MTIMMTTLEFLSYLRALDVYVEANDGDLDVDAPEGTLTTELRAELIQRKAELITFLQQAKESTQKTITFPSISREGSIPLSFPQQRMWLMSQLEQNHAVFNAPAAIRMKGRLNISALEASLNEIIRRHEILRTVLISENGKVVQQVKPALTLSLPLTNLRDWPLAEREAKVQQLTQEEADKPFNLAEPPLVRASLFQIDEEEFLFLLTLHHIVSDDWSLQVFVRELETLYEAYTAGKPSPLAELPLQYGDFAVWQRRWVNSTATQSHLAYWQKTLGNLAAVPEIPTDYAASKERSGQRQRRMLRLSQELTQQLRDLNRQEETTLFATLLAVFKIFLYQYAALTDLIVASPVAGRTHRELEGLVGFFVNTVLLRTNLSGDPTFRDLLRQIRMTTAEAHAHQELPIEEVLKALSLSQGTRFRVFFNMLSAASQMEQIKLVGLQTEPLSDFLVRAPEIGGGFDLTMIAAEHPNGLHLDVSFNADLFEARTIEWMLDHLQRLLTTIVANPGQRLSALPPLPLAEHQRVEPTTPFAQFSKTTINQSLAQRFEQQVQQEPQRIAVQVGGRTLSYDELNRSANRVARLIEQHYDDRLKLSRREKARYTRQMLLGGWGIESQEILKGTTVFVAGSGGSSTLLVQLALCGFGTIITADFDEVELSNLNRQFLHNESRIGMNKALSSKKTLDEHGFNPYVKVIAHPTRITKDNVYDLVADAAILFDLVDDPESKFALGECAVAKGIPMMLSSMIDMSSYACILHPPKTPCFRCLYDKSKLQEIEEIRSYHVKKAPQPVVSPSMFLSCAFVANEALKIILGLGDVAYNKYFFFNQRGADLATTSGHQIITYPFSQHFRRICREQGFDWDIGWSGKFVEEITLERDPDCPICGEKAQAQGNSRFIIRIDPPLSTQSQPATPPNNITKSGEQTIALLLGHDEEMVIGILATLKAGKVFAAFDPTYPEHRLTAMLEDSEARLIVTTTNHLALAERIRDKVNRHIQIVNLKEINQSISDDNLGRSIDPDQIAYLVYTSGSTGQPKGVMQSHRNVLHFIMNYTNGLHISQDDKLSLIPTFSFSAAMMDTFAALLNGATLCLFDVRQQGVADLAQWLVDQDITIYHSVPTVFRHFVANIPPNLSFPRLRLIDFGGELVSCRDVELYRQYFSPACILVNGLGATELNVIRQFYIDHHTEIIGNTIPVGYAVEDTEILLVDDHNQPVGFNRAGEIVIKSRYLSPGYWQQPELTQAVFKSDPQGSNERLYYTGDLGRMRPDGCLEHLGRKDMQVKIRGVRIEPAEIEISLLDLPGVREAVVVAQETQDGAEKRLVAYLVQEKGSQKLTGNELRSLLMERLPAAMIPSDFVILDTLPLTTSGKVNYKALPAPEQKRSDADRVAELLSRVEQLSADKIKATIEQLRKAKR